MQIWHHLWATGMNKPGCPSLWTNICITCAIVHWVSICHLVGWSGAGCHLSVHTWLSLLFVGRCDGKIPGYGVLLEAFQSSIRPIVREAFGPKFVLVVWWPYSHPEWMLSVNQRVCSPISGECLPHRVRQLFPGRLTALNQGKRRPLVTFQDHD